MLKRYSCPPGSGIFCESTSIRKGYKGDATHSNICDQWDWELVINSEQRNLTFLKLTVQKIFRIIKEAEAMLAEEWPALRPSLPDEVHFVTAEELHELWPDADIHGREDAAVRKWGAVFIVGMGWPMKDGSPPEEVRAPDYDDVRLFDAFLLL
jgi:aspartate--ammonia ligase